MVFGNGVEPRGGRIGAAQDGVRAAATGVGSDGGHELDDGRFDGRATAGGPAAHRGQTPSGQRHGRHRLAEVASLSQQATRVRGLAQRTETLGRGLRVGRRVHQLGVSADRQSEMNVGGQGAGQAVRQPPEVRARVRVVRERQPEQRVQAAGSVAGRSTGSDVHQPRPPAVHQPAGRPGGQQTVAHRRVQRPVHVVGVLLQQPVGDPSGDRVVVVVHVVCTAAVQVGRPIGRADDRLGQRVHVVKRAAVQQILVQPTVRVVGVVGRRRVRSRAVHRGRGDNSFLEEEKNRFFFIVFGLFGELRFSIRR